MTGSLANPMRPSLCLLITGATGFVGSRLAALALERGYNVRTLTRSDWSGEPAVPVVNRYFGSLPAQIPLAALRGVDVVVHCAAETDGTTQSAYAVNVEGSRRLAQLASEAGVGSFVFLSSQSARADALSLYGKTKYTAEQLLMRQAELNVIVLRPGLVTGPGRRGLYQRLARMVRSLPVIPLLGGGQSIVQPIHIDDLCEAIFRCAASGTELSGAVLHLGDPEGVSLGEFLTTIARVQLGRKRITVPIPLWPVTIVMAIAEALAIPLPVRRGNVLGLKRATKIPTGPDLKRLGLRLRPLEEMVYEEAPAVSRVRSVNERAIRVVLVGVGRIGLMHAITISRLPGVSLAGVVDRSARAIKLLRGMGLKPPAYSDFETALVALAPDAAVIATPGASHFGLTRACLERGLALLVEKPLAITAEQLTAYERLVSEFPGRQCQVGYVMLRNPQVITCLARLRAGDYGRVHHFEGLTLLSFIDRPAADRWEAQRDVAGGGAFINNGSHVLSMIHTAFGDPTVIDAEWVKLFSTGVEDSMVVRFNYSGFQGVQYCSWSMGGYPRQENMLTVITDRGRLVLTASVGVFIGHEGDVDITHQLDFEVGFNIAPDYAGAGFTIELKDLEAAARTGRPAPVGVAEAIQLERLVFKIYDSAREVRSFVSREVTSRDEGAMGGGAGRVVEGKKAVAVRSVLDLRDLTEEEVGDFVVSGCERSQWDEYLVMPGHVKVAGRLSDSTLRVTVPDFLGQARRLSMGRYAEVLKQMKLGGVVSACVTTLPHLIGERGATFWVAALAMLAGALYQVPVKFKGTLLVHSYLADIALALRRFDMLGKLLSTCRRRRPQARVGFHTAMAGEALNGLYQLTEQVDEISVLTAPGARHLGRILDALRTAGGEGTRRVTAEVGLAPPVVHLAARAEPGRWAFYADAVLIGPAAEPRLAARRREGVKREWAKAFPGCELPEELS